MALESTLLTSDLLHILFEERDGELYRKVTRGGSKAGGRAGHVGNRGYRIVVVNDRQYMEHRLIWIMHGNDPVKMLDHIDGNQLNNRIENLRLATNSQNQMNMSLPKDNTSGIKGVSWNKREQRWIGQVMLNQKAIARSSSKTKRSAGVPLPSCAKSCTKILLVIDQGLANL